MTNTEYMLSDRGSCWVENSAHIMCERRSNGMDGINVLTKGTGAQQWFSLAELDCEDAPIERAFLFALIRVTASDRSIKHADPSDLVGEQLRAGA